jgi:DNA adenine methylase
MSKKPFNWYGGKQALAPLLVSLLPRHQVYCEVFGGSGALLFAKEPSPLEVFNDLDSGVVNFFRVLRNPEQAERLQNALQITPYAREEYYDCLSSWEAADDPIEKARAWYCAVMQSMNSSIRATGWSATKAPSSNPARAWQNNITNLATCVSRLAHVEIDHRDFEQVIMAYDSPLTCFYLDPPYLAETRRKQRCYVHEMTEADHERLLTCITRVQGMIILSGYAHPLYQEALQSWECHTLTLRCSSAVRALAVLERDTTPDQLTRTECIWRNPACVRASSSLFANVEGGLL